LINLNSLGFNLILLPAVAGGALAGRWLLKLVPQLWFERILLASAALAAVRLIWHGTGLLQKICRAILSAIVSGSGTKEGPKRAVSLSLSSFV
jgi:hypothetical protein